MMTNASDFMKISRPPFETDNKILPEFILGRIKNEFNNFISSFAYYYFLLTTFR